VPGANFDELFRSTRREVDDVLADVPQSLLEARRMVTRELQFEPRPEELQVIVKIAGFMSTSVVCYELPRQMLALRVLAERELAECWGSRRLSAEKLSRTAAVIEDLLQASEQSRDAVSGKDATETLSDDEQTYLMCVRDVLDVPHDRLQASIVVAPRLELVAKQVATGNVSETFPGLSDEEVEMFNQAVHLDDSEQQGPGRVCLDAIALRTVYEEYREVWDRSGYLDDVELVERLQQEIREQLADTETAYRVVNGSLQQQQDEAISACLDDFAEDIRTAKSKLFEAHLQAQAMTRKAKPVEAEDAVGRRSLAETLDEAETADERTAARKSSSEELYLRALTSVRSDRAERDPNTHPRVIARQAYRRRLWLMAATIVVLAAAVAGTHLFLPERTPDPTTVSLKEFEPALSVIDAKPIGSMLYVRVTDWEQLSAEKIRFRALAIGNVAADKGLSLAYVVSDAGQGLAEWHANGGVLVKARPSATKRPHESPSNRAGERTVFTGN